jgi:hypothetical protein
MLTVILSIWVIGQAAPTGIEFVDFTTVGVTSVLGTVWWLERRERIKTQEQCAIERTDYQTKMAAIQEREWEMLERLLPIITEATGALKDMTQVQETLTERAASVRKPGLTDLADRIDALSQELRSSRRPKE